MPREVGEKLAVRSVSASRLEILGRGALPGPLGYDSQRLDPGSPPVVTLGVSGLGFEVDPAASRATIKGSFSIPPPKAAMSWTLNSTFPPGSSVFR